MKKSVLFIFSAVLLVCLVSCSKQQAEVSKPVESSAASGPSGSVMLYSSLKESQLTALKEGFMKKYPGIKMDFYAAGTSKVATKMATEKQSGQIACDLVWVGDPSNYITFKEQNILEQYVSPEAKNIDAIYKDPDNYFCGGRMIVMGFAYNTNTVKQDEVPKYWKDLLKPTFKNQIVMTDPGESGTTFYAVAGLLGNSEYGEAYFKQLKAMGAELESGTTSTHTKVAANAYKVCIAVDYVTETLEKDGSTIKFVYPEKDLVSISSPIALIKGAANLENGKLLYDYILSEEGQKILMNKGCATIRNDLVKENSLSTAEIVKRSMKIDDKYISEHSTDILTVFDKIFK
ncbi:MAG: ABC transporter substrate-binding protein [Treponema sp.]|nr:ABC transporter substrate-binding protein [Treponema sp.]